MKMKRFFAIILAVMMMTLCFTACDDPASSGNVSTTPNGIVNGTNKDTVDRKPNVKEIVPQEIVPQEIVPDLPAEDGTGMVGER